MSRNPERITKTLDLIYRLWSRNDGSKDLRLGQLLATSVKGFESNAFSIEDDDVIAGLQGTLDAAFPAVVVGQVRKFVISPEGGELNPALSGVSFTVLPGALKQYDQIELLMKQIKPGTPEAEEYFAGAYVQDEAFTASEIPVDKFFLGEPDVLRYNTVVVTEAPAATENA